MSAIPYVMPPWKQGQFSAMGSFAEVHLMDHALLLAQRHHQSWEYCRLTACNVKPLRISVGHRTHPSSAVARSTTTLYVLFTQWLRTACNFWNKSYSSACFQLPRLCWALHMSVHKIKINMTGGYRKCSWAEFLQTRRESDRNPVPRLFQVTDSRKPR